MGEAQSKRSRAEHAATPEGAANASTTAQAEAAVLSSVSADSKC
jgi:hypothetical protein